jgi:aldose 1-epimerase
VAEKRRRRNVQYYPSGDQYEITLDNQRAVIVSVGGGVRRYDAGDRNVLEPYELEEQCDGAHGATLVPWPNRLADGRYSFDGVTYQVPITEVDKNNAIHGFLRWQAFSMRSQSSHAVTVGTTIYPSPGYPFILDVEIAYTLSDDGLEVATTATNHSDKACPYASGHHPYLSPGPNALVDDALLTLPAGGRILTDERQLPTVTEPVDGTPYDFRIGKTIGSLAIDYGFSDLERDHDGRAWAHLLGTDGRTAEIWADSHYHVLEIYTGDTLSPDRRRRGLGVEPMTCPPNGLRSGEGVIRLEPHTSITTVWGARLR